MASLRRLWCMMTSRAFIRLWWVVQLMAYQLAFLARHFKQSEANFIFLNELLVRNIWFQGVSKAGLGLGLSDTRTGLASEIWRIYDLCKPAPLLVAVHINVILLFKPHPSNIIEPSNSGSMYFWRTCLPLCLQIRKNFSHGCRRTKPSQTKK